MKASTQPLGPNLAAFFWPTEKRRPGESFTDWLKRLDDMTNAECGTPSPWRTDA